MSFKLDRVDVAALLEEAIQSHQGLAEKFKVTFRTRHPQGTPLVVKGDESRLMQVLANMISNASKFSSDGGEVTVGARVGGRHGPDLRDGPRRGHPAGRAGKGLRPVLAARLLRSASHGRNRARHEHLARDRGSDGRRSTTKANWASARPSSSICRALKRRVFRSRATRGPWSSTCRRPRTADPSRHGQMAPVGKTASLPGIR
jgi:hypothetical protein